jgi:hypothetical protein
MKNGCEPDLLLVATVGALSLALLLHAAAAAVAACARRAPAPPPAGTRRVVSPLGLAVRRAAPFREDFGDFGPGPKGGAAPAVREGEVTVAVGPPAPAGGPRLPARTVTVRVGRPRRRA